MSDLDDTDRKILTVLRQNAREPIKGIAQKTGIARSTVRHRMERMEQNGVISGYRVELNVSEAQGIEAFLLIKLTHTPAYNVVEEMARHPEIKRCYSLSGETDLIVEMAADQAENLNKVRDAIAGLKEVSSVQTSIILSKNIS